MQQSTVWLLLIFAAGLIFLPAVAGATAPSASFTSNITTGTTVPFSVQFIDTSGNDPVSRVWSFGDGGSSTEQDPSHTYTAAGTYTVTLTATNADGSNTKTKTGYITVSKSTTAPVAAFISNITTGTNPLSIQFVDSSSSSPTAWAWSFGDGGTSSVQNPVHTFTRDGIYTVTLSAVNSAGSSTVSKDAFVTVTVSSSAPVASFTSTDTCGISPLTVEFIDSSANSPTAWAWSFGDGGTSSVQNPSHTYVSAGTYTVTMTATNSGGSSTSTELDMITVELTEPIPSFEANVTEGEPPLVVRFTDTSVNAPTSWYWYFGDEGTSTEQDPVHEYTDDGIYTVSFTATNSEGSNTTTVSKYINVTAITAPVPTFEADITSGTVPLTVRFTDTSTYSPVSWDWTFGDGSSSTEQNPRHTYTATGSYSVTLTVTNAGGSRTATTSHYIVVTSDTSSAYTNQVSETAIPVETVEEPAVLTDTSVMVTPTGSAQDSLPGNLPIIILVVLAGIGAIVLLLMRRPPRGPSHTHKKDL
ncbi:MAG: PKD domain-containing protein [Methanoregula sp.]|nr:PKD domain-containing protein [Methanoregula sp.]